MKKKFTLLFVFALFFQAMQAQTPCSGTPASNTVISFSGGTLCAGSTTSLWVANTYSTNSGIAYQWQSSTISPVGPFMNMPGATLSTISSGQLNMTTYFNVIITCTNSSQSIQVPYTMTVVNCPAPCSGTPTPASIVPPSPSVCANNSANMGLSITYTNSGIAYQWKRASSPAGTYTSIPGATQSTYNTPALTSNAYYSVLVTCQNSGGNYTAVDSVSVYNCTACAGVPGSNTVFPVTQTLCPGGAASMSLASSYTASGIVYQWQSSTVSAVGPFSTIPGATLSTYNSGILNSTTYYNVLITCSNSSQSTNAGSTASVVNCSPPSTCVANANFSLVPTGTPQVWNAIPAQTSSIAAAQWSWGDGSNSNTMFTSHTYSAPGMYSICLSVTASCGATATACASYSIYRGAGVVQVNVVESATVGMDELNLLQKNVHIYPNPNNGQFNLQVSGDHAISSIEIRNIVGQIVYSSQEPGKGNLNKDIDLSHLQDGIYFVKISQGDISVTSRISIQK